MNFLRYGTFPVEQLTPERCRGDSDRSYGSKISYFYVKDAEPVQWLRDKVKPDGMRWVEIYEYDIRPHVDHGITAALNLYVQPSGAKTTFWTRKPGATASLFPGETVPSIYKQEDLNESDSFVAQPGDAYWLDVQKIHTVTGMTGVRLILQMSWTTKRLSEVVCLP